MEKLPRDMKRKRQRHFSETKTIISVACMISGVCLLFCLLFVWPQVSNFNHRIRSYALIFSFCRYIWSVFLTADCRII